MAKKKKEAKVKVNAAINVSMLFDINNMVDEFVDIPRSAFPKSVREVAQDIQARLIALRSELIIANDWDTHCVDDKDLY